MIPFFLPSTSSSPAHPSSPTRWSCLTGSKAFLCPNPSSLLSFLFFLFYIPSFRLHSSSLSVSLNFCSSLFLFSLSFSCRIPLRHSFSYSFLLLVFLSVFFSSPSLCLLFHTLFPFLLLLTPYLFHSFTFSLSIFLFPVHSSCPLFHLFFPFIIYLSLLHYPPSINVPISPPTSPPPPPPT